MANESGGALLETTLEGERRPTGCAQRTFCAISSPRTAIIARPATTTHDARLTIARPI